MSWCKVVGSLVYKVSISYVYLEVLSFKYVNVTWCGDGLMIITINIYCIY